MCVFSSDTVNLFLPLALRAASTRWPFFDDERNLNPCLFFLLLTDGWYVLFIIDTNFQLQNGPVFEILGLQRYANYLFVQRVPEKTFQELVYRRFTLFAGCVFHVHPGGHSSCNWLVLTRSPSIYTWKVNVPGFNPSGCVMANCICMLSP